jgi:hypothetical protein
MNAVRDWSRACPGPHSSRMMGALISKRPLLAAWEHADDVDPELRRTVTGRLRDHLASGIRNVHGEVADASPALGRTPDGQCIAFYDDDLHHFSVIAPALGTRTPLTVYPDQCELAVIDPPELLPDLSRALWQAQRGDAQPARMLAYTLAAEQGLRLIDVTMRAPTNPAALARGQIARRGLACRSAPCLRRKRTPRGPCSPCERYASRRMSLPSWGPSSCSPRGCMVTSRGFTSAGTMCSTRGSRSVPSRGSSGCSFA